jgi:ATP-dependent Clp protease protease subunit
MQAPLWAANQARPDSGETELGLPRPLAESLFESRTVLIFGEVDTALARTVSAQLLALAARSAEPIRVLINSQGGHVESGDTLFDLIRYIEPRVIMIGTGWVVSAGALIYCAAERKNRLTLPNTRFLLHQPLSGVSGPASDVEIEAAQIVAVRERLNRVFAEATGQDYAKVARDTDRNFWMNANAAREYGLVARIIERASEVDGS